MFDFETLKNAAWEDLASKIYLPLKKEMQGNTGFIRRIKDKDDAGRKARIAAKMASFWKKNDLSDLDDEIDELANSMLSINNEYSTIIYYDHLEYFPDDELKKGKPLISKIDAFLQKPKASTLAKRRLSAIVARVVNESLSQANKANAGEAGENIVRSVLSAAGLNKDVHFREQYKSKKGSDTDFVFPNVEDGQDQKVEVFLAVQMSSNDRTRLASSELKQGAIPFVFTGNGLSASKKNLKDIGNQIIEDQKSKGIKMICFKAEIAQEKDRLKKAIKIRKKKADKKALKSRLDYIENYTWDFSEFAEYIKKKFS